MTADFPAYFRNYAGQKRVKQHLQNTERKKLSTQNSVLGKISFSKKGKIFSKQGKLRKSISSSRAQKEIQKKVMQTKGK